MPILAGAYHKLADGIIVEERGMVKENLAKVLNFARFHFLRANALLSQLLRFVRIRAPRSP